MELQLKQQKHHPLNNPAFVLGNGVSRLRVNLENLKTYGTIYGCNALYREFTPHYLIAVDVKMVNEIISSGYHKNHEVWTNPNKGITSKDQLNFFDPHKGWSSGPTALWLAARQQHPNIFIFGFDYQGLENGRVNNVYAGTHNYKKSTDSATFYGNWASQTDKVFGEFKKVNFYRVSERNAFLPERINKNHVNVNYITFSEFEEMCPDTIYSDKILQKTTI